MRASDSCGPIANGTCDAQHIPKWLINSVRIKPSQFVYKSDKTLTPTNGNPHTHRSRRDVVFEHNSNRKRSPDRVRYGSIGQRVCI